MELKEFVSEALIQIIEGVKEAQNKVGSRTEGEVNPTFKFANPDKRYVSSNGGVIHFVNFDVAVTVVEGKGAKGGLGIFAGAISLGAQGESMNSNSSVSRIKFEVPITLPEKELQ